jgi:MFS transporter, SP family, general alpha glucoside:H+ symporter
LLSSPSLSLARPSSFRWSARRFAGKFRTQDLRVSQLTDLHSFSLPWGIFATIGPAYASEILPLALRGYLTSYTNMCFAIGQFISAGVLKSFLNRPDSWSYKIPFALQWLWPPFLLLSGWFMPESPWWLVRAGRHEEAERMLKRLTVGEQNSNTRQTIAMMVHTNEIEKEVEAGTSFLDCFKGTNRRRTEIACVAFAGQVLSGR